MLRRLLAFSLALLAIPVVVSPTANAFQLGFNDEDLMMPALGNGRGADDTDLLAGVQNAKAAGGSIWRVQIRWSDVAPTAPPSAAQAADPNWSGYQWAPVDRQLRAIASTGMEPLVYISKAPPWAEGAGRPAVTPLAPPGTWRPDATALKPFATAVAKRYRGDFPDPLVAGATLPRIPVFQGWNEPNLFVELTPQFIKSGGRYVNASAGMYRKLQNAIYDGIKGVDPTIKVFAASTAPFGDYPDGGNRTPPAEFYRDLLCIQTVSNRLFAESGCSKIHFDGFAHNPYSPFAPTRKAANIDDVTVPDLGKLTRLVKAGVRAGTVTPRGNKPVWITELAIESAPDPMGVSQATQAQYIQGAVSILAHEGASAVLLWNVRDDAPIDNYATTYQSGIFTRGTSVASDAKKPSWTAYRFPVSAYRDHGSARLWGKAPAPGPVVIQRLRGRAWVSYTTLQAGADGVFAKTVRTSSTIRFRAVQGAFTSLSAAH